MLEMYFFFLQIRCKASFVNRTYHEEDDYHKVINYKFKKKRKTSSIKLQTCKMYLQFSDRIYAAMLRIKCRQQVERYCQDSLEIKNKIMFEKAISFVSQFTELFICDDQDLYI